MTEHNQTSVPILELSTKKLITVPCQRQLFAKPYCWKALSTSIESNHDKNNLRFKAIAAKMALKDAFHMRYHTIDFQKQGAKFRQHNEDTYFEPEKHSREKRSLGRVELESAEMLQIHWVTDESIRDAPDEWIIEKSTQSKATSIELQEYILGCEDDCLAKLIRIAQKRMIELMFHRFGNYIIQNLMQRSLGFTAAVRSYCEVRFDKLVANQYSSRVVQKLIEYDDQFRVFASQSFKQNIQYFLAQQTAWYLIVSVVRFADTEGERDIVSRYMQRCRTSWFENKSFLKVLIIYLEHCSEVQVKFFVKSVQLEKRLFKFLQDKLSCLIFFKLLERNEAFCEQILLGQLSRDLISLLQTHFFGYLVGMIARSEHTKRTALCIALALRSTGEHTFKILWKRPVLFQLFSGAVTILNLHEIQKL